MEPRREEQPKAPEPGAEATRPEEKRKRSRLIKLEERIAPSNGGTHGNKVTCGGCISVGCGSGGLSVE